MANQAMMMMIQVAIMRNFKHILTRCCNWMDTDGLILGCDMKNVDDQLVGVENVKLVC